MPRVARLVYPEHPHHVVQRGNRRQQVFFEPHDYERYLAIATRAFREADVEVWAYCLMPNHVHLIATPRHAAGLGKAMAALSARYSRYINQSRGWRGSVWQGRFSSFPMDDKYLGRCLRYVAFNPVRAKIADRPEAWRWSSARAYLSRKRHPLLSPWPVVAKFPDVGGLFAADVSEREMAALRKATGTGSPLGSDAWLARRTGDTHSPCSERQDTQPASCQCVSPG